MENDLISRQAAIDAISKWLGDDAFLAVALIKSKINKVPSAQPETCEGCKHLGIWENEVEYGYPSPCTRCKRRVGDHYER